MPGNAAKVAVLAAQICYGGGSGYCFASYDTIATHSGHKDRHHALKYQRELHKDGIITILPDKMVM